MVRVGRFVVEVAAETNTDRIMIVAVSVRAFGENRSAAFNFAVFLDEEMVTDAGITNLQMGLMNLCGVEVSGNCAVMNDDKLGRNSVYKFAEMQIGIGNSHVMHNCAPLRFPV